MTITVFQGTVAWWPYTLLPKSNLSFSPKASSKCISWLCLSEVQDTDNDMGLLTYYLSKYKENRIGAYSKS